MVGTVLIAHSIAIDRILLREFLASSFYEVRSAATAKEAMRILATDTVDVALLEAGLLPIQDISQGPTELLVLTGNSAASRVGALLSGAADIVSWPSDARILLGKIHALMRQRADTAEVAAIEQTHRAIGLSEAASAFVPKRRVALFSASSGIGAMRALWQAQGLDLETVGPVRHRIFDKTARWDAIVLDGTTDPDAANALLADIQVLPAQRRPATIAVFAPHQHEAASHALNFQTGDVMVHGFCHEELEIRLARQIARRQAAIRAKSLTHAGLNAAMTDGVTGLLNRRAALPRLASWIERETPFAVMMVDLDHLKQVNDIHGHAAGDLVLRTVAQTLKAATRPQDLAARFGGDEFLVARPGLTGADAEAAACSLQKSLSYRPIDAPGGGKIRMSASVGVAVWTSGTLDATLARADQALYRAKSRGRNRVVSAPPDWPITGSDAIPSCAHPNG